jgi:amino acid adenylation domain-containing protein
MDAFELSPQQKHVWHLDPDVHARTARVYGTLRLTGVWPWDALRPAALAVVRRHEILRMVFKVMPGVAVPVQAIAHADDAGDDAVDVTVHDLRPLDAAARPARARDLLAEHADRAIDLERGPVLSICAIRLDDDTSEVGMGLPALCGDRRGLEIVASEMLHVWQRSDGPLAAPAIQYADAAATLRAFLEDEESPGKTVWRDLASSTEPATVPFAVAAPPTDTLTGTPASARVACAVEIARDVDHLASSLRVERSTVLLAVWQAVIGRLCARRRFWTAVMLDGRTHPVLGEAPGLFSRVVPVRCQTDAGFSWADFVAATGRARADAAQWQEDLAWDRLNDGHGARVHPAWLFDHHARHAGRSWPAGAAANWTFVDARLARADLALIASEDGERLSVALSWDPRRVRSADAHRLANHLTTLAAAAVRRPADPLDRLPLHDDDDVRELRRIGTAATSFAAPEPPLSVEVAPSLLGGATGARPANPAVTASSIVDQFERAAADRPDALAVVASGVRWSYATLNRHANRIARSLRAHGVGPESCVALLLERDAHLIASLLGTLKAGAAYVPIEPDSPPDRIAIQLRQARVSLVLTSSDRSPSWKSAVGADIITLSPRAAAADDGTDDRNLGLVVPPQALAYVIFTSGSTGVPKAIGVSHANLAAYVSAVSRVIGPCDRWGLVSTVAADLGHTVTFPALSSGGTLHILPADRVIDGRFVADYLQREDIGCVKVTPSQLQAWLDVDPAAVPGVCLVLGGEASSWTMVNGLQARHPQLRLVNHYGPTECTVGATTYAIDAASAEPEGECVPIGSPLAGTSCWILDREGELASRLASGELYIGGSGVARGYIGRPDLTAARFVPDPLSTEPGARMYRTGDRVRWTSRDAIAFLGRVDRQVKVRGFRVEPGEIEAALSGHPAITRAAVVARPGPHGQRLIAYVAAPPTIGESEILAWLAERLPDHLVPTRALVLARLPLTANGKIDHASLTDADAAHRLAAVASGDTPATPLHEIVGGVWAAALERDEVPARASFFDLGGHSLLAARVVARVSALIGRDVPVATIFQHPTLHGFVQAVAACVAAPPGAAVPALVAGESDAAAPASDGQRRLWVMQHLDPASPAYNCPAILRLRGAVRHDLLARAITTIVTRHAVLRTTLTERDGDVIQIVHPPGPVTVSLIDLTDLSPEAGEASARAVAEAMARRAFDLERAVFRVCLVRRAADAHDLLITLHHAVTDGWSTTILVREFSTLYDALVAGTDARLPALPVQYADYARWQHECLDTPLQDAHRAYWREMLAGLTPLPLLTDFPRPLRQPPSATLRFVLPADVGARLLAFGREESVTPFITTLAAFQLLLSGCTGSSDIAVGIPTTNRIRVELEDLIGFFVNTLILRTRVHPDLTFRELVANVRRTALEAYGHQDVPFDAVVRLIAPPRAAGTDPLVRTMFSLRRAAPDPLRLADLSVDASDNIGTGTAKFDLMLTLLERGPEFIGTFGYHAGLFLEDTIRGMAEQFTTIVARATARPDERLWALELESGEAA